MLRSRTWGVCCRRVLLCIALASKQASLRAFHRVSSHYDALRCNTLHSVAFHCATLRYPALRYVVICIAQRCAAL